MKERSKKDTQKEQEAEAPIINPGFGAPLMITHNGFVMLHVHIYQSLSTHRSRRFVGQTPTMMNGTGLGMTSVKF